jgi:hypothetical protein
MGNNIFRNVLTNQTGEVPDELAEKIFNISLDATEMIKTHPNVEYLIKQLDLRVTQNQ